MKTSRIKKFVFATLVGGIVFGGGCLSGGGMWGRMLWTSAISVATDFVTDNDAVFDLFEDGEPTATDTTE